MNSWINFTKTISDESVESIQSAIDVNVGFYTETMSIISELSTTVFAQSNHTTQNIQSCRSPYDFNKVASELLAANVSTSVRSFSQFLSASGAYRNQIHQMAEASLLSIGDGNKALATDLQAQ